LEINNFELHGQLAQHIRSS